MNDHPAIEKAKGLVYHFHTVLGEQKRKYTGEPYTEHLHAVERKYSEHFPDDLVGRIVALCHDLFEDTEAAPWDVETWLGSVLTPNELLMTIGTIWELTDEFTKEAFPTLNRAARKDLEAKRLAGVSLRAKRIKLCDLIDNSKSILACAPKFAPVYLAEKRQILEGFEELKGSPLWHEAWSLCAVPA